MVTRPSDPLPQSSSQKSPPHADQAVKHYWEFLRDKDFSEFSEDQKNLFYFKWMEKDKEVELDFIRLPSLRGFLNESTLAQAQLEASAYS